MKKYRISIAVAVLITLLLTACGGSKQPIASTSEEFKNLAGSYISLENYELSESDGVVEYELQEALLTEINSKVDFTFSFENGGTIQLPLSRKTLADAGWVLTETPYIILLDAYANEKGQTIGINIRENRLVSGATDHELEIENYIRGLDENFETTLHKNEDVPAFTILGKITNDSSLEEIVETLGQPWSMKFEESTAYDVPMISLWYGKYDGGHYVGGIQFRIDAETNEIIDVRCTYLEYQ